MKSEIEEVLQKNGLTQKEAKIYLSLLEIKESTPHIIAKRTGLKRPTVYNTLDALKKRGLISYNKKNKALRFSALPPNKLFKDTEARLNEFKKILPFLNKLEEQFGKQPQMSIFEGENGLIEIMEDTLSSTEDLLCWVNPELALLSLREYYPKYIEKKRAKNIWVKGIFCYDKTALKLKKRGQKELREVYLIPKDKFPFKNEINIYDDKVAIISHQDQVGVIIQNKNIADTQKAIFNLGFEYAKILEKELLTAEDLEYLKEK